MKSFSAKVNIIGVNPYVLLPASVLKYIFKKAGKDKGAIPVQLKIGDKHFIQNLVRYSGKWRLYLNTPMRIAANKDVGDKRKLYVLHLMTVVFGLFGLFAGIAMIGIKSLLDAWWELSGIFAGGMLGLFLLGLISRNTTSTEALTAVIIGIVVILWMTFSGNLSGKYAFLKSPLHKNMVIVVGTLTIFLAGLLLTARKRKLLASPLPKAEAVKEIH